MGCTSSNLSRQGSLRRRRGAGGKSLTRKQKQAISVVGVFLQKGYSLRLIRSESHGNIPDPFHKKEGLASPSRSDRPYTGGDGESEELPEMLSFDLSGDGAFSRIHVLESPRTLCTEQERRLRCANMEGPTPGFTSDEDDDEGDGFEFAKMDCRIASFSSENGHVWTPIARFDSEQAIKRVFSAEAFLDSPHSRQSEALTADSSCCELQDSSILEPELQILISPDYRGLPFSDSDNQSMPMSPVSIRSSQISLSPCSPLLERFPSDSMDQLIGVCSISDDSAYLPAILAPFEGSSFALLSTSCSESFRDYSPASDAFSAGSTKWVYPSPSWRNHSFSDSPPIEKVMEGHRSYGDVHGSRWGHPSPSPAKSLHVHDSDSLSEALIPGLPNDLAQLCLMRLPFIKYDQSFRMVCRRWRDVLSSEEFFKTRSALGIHDVYISFVVHGNRVQIFSLQYHQWFCLPPLPREYSNASPRSRVSIDCAQSPDSQPSSRGGTLSDCGIDPYDWWQIDTVAVSGRTLFVIGGDRAELHSFTRPSKPTTRVHRYDYCRNCWVPVTCMQIPRSHAAAISSDSLLYVAGGSENVDDGASVEVYDFQQNKWSMISSMNTSMRTCVGVEYNGCLYVKGENVGPGCYVEGEVFKPTEGRWARMSPGMKRGLERGPMTSCKAGLFVADWKDFLLKVYDFKAESWIVVTKLPARISRLAGHSFQLYALTGKIKVDSFNHHVISDAPAEVWRLDVHHVIKMFEDGEGIEKFSRENDWECIWRDSKQMVKTGGLAWVPCIAHCTIFED